MDILSAVETLMYRTLPSGRFMIHPPSLRANSQSISAQCDCASQVVLNGALSSSASTMKITSRLSGTFSRARRITASANTAMPPLKSIAPRPQTYPSLTRPAKGSTVHCSRSTPTTSACAAIRTGFRLPSPFSLAIRWALPACGVGKIDTWNPSGLNFPAINSSSAASLPGGLLVSTRINSESNSAVGLAAYAAANIHAKANASFHGIPYSSPRERRVCLGAQRDHRSNANRAPRWNPTRQQGDDCKCHRNAGEGHWIVRRNSKEKAAHPMRRSQRADQPCQNPGQRQPHARPEREQQNVARLSAQRHPNAEFLRALADGIGHHAVDSDGGQKQSQ